ncbi:hypothetical protein [Micromonospora sp. NPDC003241]
MARRERAETVPTVSTGIGLLPALGVALAVLWPVFTGALWAAPLSGLVAWAAIGVWRLVQMQGMVVNHLHWRDVEMPTGSSEQETP